MNRLLCRLTSPLRGGRNRDVAERGGAISGGGLCVDTNSPTRNLLRSGRKFRPPRKGEVAWLVGLAIVLSVSSAAHAAADVSAGEGLFNRCAICHSNTKGGPNKLGPNLFGVVGRKAGTYPGFSYSSAMKNAGFTWSAAKLNDYLASPQKVVPGNNMPFAGISDAKQRADLVAYLATLK